MVYKEIKEYLQGYVEYLSIMNGIDFKLDWRGVYKEFAIRAKNPKNDGVHRYIDLVVFNMADIKSVCEIQIKSFTYVDIYRTVVDQLREKGYVYRKIPPYIVNIKVYDKEKLYLFLGLLEEAEYFSMGWQ